MSGTPWAGSPARREVKKSWASRQWTSARFSMLTKAPIGRETLDNQQRGLAAIVAAGVLAGLVFLIQDSFGGKAPVSLQHATTAQLGASIFRGFVLPFEVVSVLLLAALVGAVVIARKDEGT